MCEDNIKVDLKNGIGNCGLEAYAWFASFFERGYKPWNSRKNLRIFWPAGRLLAFQEVSLRPDYASNALFHFSNPVHYSYRAVTQWCVFLAVESFGK